MVRSDLAWLARTFENGSRDHDDLRRASAVVRRLLVDGALQQARKQLRAEAQARLAVYPLEQMLDLSDVDGITLVAASGCRIEHRQLGPFSMNADQFEIPTPLEMDWLPLPRFMKSRCLVANGLAVTRQEVVKYIANKLGGVHFQTSRGGTRDGYIQHLEELDGFLIMKPLSVVHLTLLSIIQAVVSSETVMVPFGLSPIDFRLDVPLQSGGQEFESVPRAWVKYDLLGDDRAH